MKFKDFQAPVLFSSTFKALNLGEKIQVLSRTFKDAWNPVISLQVIGKCGLVCSDVTRICRDSTEIASISL